MSPLRVVSLQQHGTPKLHLGSLVGLGFCDRGVEAWVARLLGLGFRISAFRIRAEVAGNAGDSDTALLSHVSTNCSNTESIPAHKII